jgi:hypothetical protein
MTGAELEYVKTLAGLPERVRTDVALALLAVIRAVSSRWRSRRAVPMLWVVVDAPGGGTPVATVRPARSGELTRGGYLDDVHHSFGPDVRAQVEGHRCAALAYGDRIYGRAWGLLGVLLAGPTPADSFVWVHLVHADGVEVRFSLPVTWHGVVFRRLRFDPALRTHLVAIAAP